MGSVSDAIDLDVIIVGGGFSGIANLYRMRKLGLRTKIFESGDDLGGVWYWNRYPGARVDSEWPYYQLNIPEVYKTFCFTERFPDHVQIRRYVSHVDKVLGLKKDIYFNAHVNSGKWDDAEGKWTIRTEQGHVAKAKYLILATGLLHRRHYPDFPGLSNYKGTIHHSGFWLETLSTKGKKVGLIGAGATAVQITQEVAKDAEKLTIFMRRPSYCLPIGQRPISEEENRAFHNYFDVLFAGGRKSRVGFPFAALDKGVFDVTEEERQKFWEDNWTRGGFQFSLRNFNDGGLNEKANAEIYKFWAAKTRARMRPGRKRDLMAPPPEQQPYYFGTKRSPLEIDYYEMVDQDNVDVVNLNETPLKTFTEKGMLLEDGTEQDFDIVILATGFDSFSGSLTSLGLKNRDGVDVKDIWKEGISTYLGMAFKGFPNAFMVYSPQAPTALSNGPTIIECQADFVAEVIQRMNASNIRSIEPQAGAQEEWCNFIDAMARKTLLQYTNSWWTGGNIPGKKPQMLSYVLGIETYEKQCREKLEGWQGFDVEYSTEGKPVDGHQGAAPSG